MKSLIFSAVATLLISACQDKTDKQLVCTSLRSPTAVKEDQIPKAVAETYWLWPHRIDMPVNLVVKFMNGSDFQRSQVVKYVTLWKEASATGANARHKINIYFVNDDYSRNTNVRVLFGQGGSSSYVGSDCNNVKQNQPTTIFGWIDRDHSDEEIRQVVLHEFGHVLGLVHEHQSPVAEIKWDSARVYKFYHDTQNPPWDPEMVNENVFRHYDRSTTNFTKFDPKSIMLYAIPAYLTKDGYSTNWNANLSETDKDFIRRIYPYQPCEPGVTCCFDRRNRRVPCP